MNNKRIIIATTTTAVVLAIGGGVWATAANADVQGGERDKVGNAAVQAVGGGTATEVDTSDDPGEAYEVEVRKQDGSEVDVALDKDLKVLTQQADTPDANDTDTDAGDRVLSAEERATAEKAALGAVSNGTILDVEAGDDQGVGYEVEVRGGDDMEWDVELDTAFKVLTKTADN